MRKGITPGASWRRPIQLQPGSILDASSQLVGSSLSTLLHLPDAGIPKAGACNVQLRPSCLSRGFWLVCCSDALRAHCERCWLTVQGTGTERRLCMKACGGWYGWRCLWAHVLQMHGTTFLKALPRAGHRQMVTTVHGSLRQSVQLAMLLCCACVGEKACQLLHRCTGHRHTDKTVNGSLRRWLMLRCWR